MSGAAMLKRTKELSATLGHRRLMIGSLAHRPVLHRANAPCRLGYERRISAEREKPELKFAA